MIWLIRKLFWIGLFLVATFAFLVLFEHGTDDFAKNAQQDFQSFKASLATKPAPKKDESHKAAQ
ncbi:MAG: hypothetical protein WCH43_09825 [Verrucomicrobiota bacterium]